MAEFNGADLLSTADLSKSEIDKIMETAEKFFPVASKSEKSNILDGFILASLFYEPSTRTRLSFETAMNRLGGRVITVSESESSSISKGETLSDTAKVIGNFADIMAIRHSKAGSVAEMAQASDVPVINAGDGSGEHPTQALLDLFTIIREKKKVDGLTIAMVGDLKYGRTVHSLSYLLSHYGVNLIFVSPEQLQMPVIVKNYLDQKKTGYREMESMEDALAKSDICYMTRIQRERFIDPAEYEKYKDCYVLTRELIEKYNHKLTVMHPLPRVGEISINVDSLPGAAYFRQVQNGVAVRMALLALILNKS